LVDVPIVPAVTVADAAVSATAPAAAAGLSRGHAPEPSPDGGDGAAAPNPSPRSVDVVWADLTDTAEAVVDGRLGMLAAGVLRGGGILAVLSCCHHDTDGALVDATGRIVASAQDADLLYLQHIVIPTGPLRAPRATDVAEHQAPARPTMHKVAHADLLVFARPRTATTRPDTALSGDVSGCGPSGAMVAAASSRGGR
jgi:hypothetical protein